jgi:hypothetical protein
LPGEVSLPGDECGGSEDQQDHACGQPGPGAPFVGAVLPAGDRGADGSWSGPVQVGHVEQRDAETGDQAGQSSVSVLSPGEQDCCKHRQWQHEQPDGRSPEEAQGVAGADDEPGSEPYPARPGEWAAPSFPDSRIDAISCCELPIQVLVEGLLRSPVAEC